MPLKVTYQNIFYILIIAGLLTVLWWKSCNGNHHPNALAEKLQKQITTDSIERIEERKVYQDSLKDIRGQMQLQLILNAEHEANLSKLDKRIDQLLTDHNNLPAPIPFDSGSSIVSNRWLDACSGCFVALKNGRDSVKLYISERDKLDNLYKKDTALRGRRIDTLEANINKKDIALKGLLARYVKDTKPKASLSGGLMYQYSPVVSDIGVYLTFRTRKQKEFGIQGGGNTLSSYFVGIRAGAKIF